MQVGPLGYNYFTNDEYDYSIAARTADDGDAPDVEVPGKGMERGAPSFLGLQRHAGRGPRASTAGSDSVFGAPDPDRSGAGSPRQRVAIALTRDGNVSVVKAPRGGISFGASAREAQPVAMEREGSPRAAASMEELAVTLSLADEAAGLAKTARSPRFRGRGGTSAGAATTTSFGAGGMNATAASGADRPRLGHASVFDAAPRAEDGAAWLSMPQREGPALRPVPPTRRRPGAQAGPATRGVLSGASRTRHLRRAFARERVADSHHRRAAHGAATADGPATSPGGRRQSAALDASLEFLTTARSAVTAPAAAAERQSGAPQAGHVGAQTTYLAGHAPRRNRPARYNTMMENIDASERRYKLMRDHQVRFKPTRRDPVLEHAMRVVDYDTNKGHWSDLERQSQLSPHTYRILSSKTERFKQRLVADPEIAEASADLTFDDPDRFTKESFATKVARLGNPAKHAMDSEVPRFRSVPLGHDASLAEAVNQLDYGEVLEPGRGPLALEVVRSPRKYAIMTSQVRRFDESVPEPMYTAPMGPGYFDPHPDRGFAPHLAHGGSIGRAPRFPPKSKTRIISQGVYYDTSKEFDIWNAKGFAASNSKRMTSLANAEAVDQLYNIDQGPKQSLVTSMLRSPRRMKILDSKVPRMKDTAKPETSEELGPGAYFPVVTRTGWPAETGVKDPKRGTHAFTNVIDRFPTTPRDPNCLHYVDPSTKAALSENFMTYEGVYVKGTIKESIETTGIKYKGMHSNAPKITYHGDY